MVYYLLRKAKGFSIEGHPIVRSLIETRLFLEKVWICFNLSLSSNNPVLCLLQNCCLYLWQIRPIDKKLQYQIHKLTRVTTDTTEVVGPSKKESDASKRIEDPLMYHPNLDLLVPQYNIVPPVSQDIDVSSSDIKFLSFKLSFTKMRNKLVIFVF